MLPFDIREALGADAGEVTVKVSIYIPSHDRNQTPLYGRADAEKQVVLQEFSRAFGGATEAPAARGAWLMGDTLIIDHPVEVYTFVPESRLPEAVALLRKQAVGIGYRLNQDAMGVTVGGQWFTISDYAKAA